MRLQGNISVKHISRYMSVLWDFGYFGIVCCALYVVCICVFLLIDKTLTYRAVTYDHLHW